MMDWDAVIDSLTETMRGAELSARATDDPMRKLEARIVSGIAASLANAFTQGLARHQTKAKEADRG